MGQAEDRRHSHGEHFPYFALVALDAGLDYAKERADACSALTLKSASLTDEFRFVLHPVVFLAIKGGLP